MSDTVNYIFPPDKYKIVLNAPPDISCYYTTDGTDPEDNNGRLYDPGEGILLDVGTYTVKVAIHKDGIKGNTIARNKYIICSADVINIIMTKEQEQLVYKSRNQRIEFDNPKPVFKYRDQEYDLDNIRIRGESSLRFRRKSFSVHLNEPIQVENREYSGIYHSMKSFKLISMVYDFTYIENRIGMALLQEVNLWNLFYKYVEVRINGNTQGTYMLIEDPEDYVIDKLRSEFILRRGYQAQISKYEYEPLIFNIAQEDYENTYYKIYSLITAYDSVSLFDSLAHIMNINEYFRKMAVDYLLKNGDLTDEVYFYSQIKDSKIYYNIMPWDYDDIFADNPHEIGRNWGMGNLFGVRSYSSVEDIINDVGDKLIFSIEDDLDYKIARDDYLYSIYLVSMQEVVNKLDDNYIEKVFLNLKKELKPFYANTKIIEQSKYDNDSTNYDLYIRYYSDKLDFIIQRRAEILAKLN
ncbi:MAG: CotH kinase family protein [Bacteroidales bacterium]|nr:MAG: CotH kinase family protein [Bacteroidales bacterium]